MSESNQNDPENPKLLTPEESAGLWTVWGLGVGVVTFGEAIIRNQPGSELVAFAGAVGIGIGVHNLIKTIKYIDQAPQE